MDLFKQGIKGPSRPAPAVPGVVVNRYSPVTNWNDDPFGADVFEPNPQHMQKKQPPPRPPPPKVNTQPDVPSKPSHFIRKPTVLSSLLSRKNKTTMNNHNINTKNVLMDFNSDIDPNKMFPKCEPKNVQTATLIDLSSPPSSPTFTTRSSSDGLSVDSFGSDATTSTNHQNVLNGGNASQAESGFEDDFDLFLHSRKVMSKDDTLDDFTTIDPFSPLPASKPPIMKKPTLSKEFYEIPNKSINKTSAVSLKGPTIIRAKPARPKPPDNSSLLNTFDSNFLVTSMQVNTTTPIQKVCNGFGDSFDSKPFNWEEENSSERESSPPMPSIPPPPPPVVDEDTLPEWSQESSADVPEMSDNSYVDDEPYAVALFDYYTDHPEDLSFSANAKIKLIRRIDDEWLFGKLRSGVQGLFPANYVEIKIPLPNETVAKPMRLGTATAVYDFIAEQTGDLPFLVGDTISVMYKINDEWYFGECKGMKGQFPSNYVQMSYS